MKRRKVGRRKYRKILKRNAKFHKKNLPGAAVNLRGGRRLPL